MRNTRDTLQAPFLCPHGYIGEKRQRAFSGRNNCFPAFACKSGWPVRAEKIAERKQIALPRDFQYHKSRRRRKPCTFTELSAGHAEAVHGSGTRENRGMSRQESCTRDENLFLTGGRGFSEKRLTTFKNQEPFQYARPESAEKRKFQPQRRSEVTPKS